MIVYVGVVVDEAVTGMNPEKKPVVPGMFIAMG